MSKESALRFASRNRSWLVAGLFVLAAFLVGYLAGGGPSGRNGSGSPPALAEHAGEGSVPTAWTCSMHPQIKLPAPGQCPICYMDLIPLEAGAAGEDGPRRLVMSDGAVQLAEIRTSPVERRFVQTEIRMVGKVELDETRLAHLTAWVPGRLDRLFVDFTGVKVRKGDHMVDIYSPELVAAHEELLQALRAVRELADSGVGIVRETAEATVQAVRERLRLWGLTPGQIQELERSEKPQDHITIHAPVGGIVLQKNAVEGMYVETGTRIYTIADLSQVWVKLDAYESDMTWIRYGQDVEFSTQAYPGERFHGRIVFIDPVLNPTTRTVKIRVNVENPEGKLKPGMFVRAVVRAGVAGSGKVMDPDFAGKWICPMHPDVVKGGRGDCTICGMPLVPTESLGYSTASQSERPLVIPATAPLITGERAVVYVRVPGKEKPTFEGREVVLGPRAGNFYLVTSGLEEGEAVVTNGNFKIDSALQIQAKPSMMSPDGGGAAPTHRHGDVGGDTKVDGAHAPAAAAGGEEPGATKSAVPARFVASLSPLYQAYFDLQESLAGDDAQGSRAAFGRVWSAVEDVPGDELPNPLRARWLDLAKDLQGAALVGEDEDVSGLRAAFRDLSLLMIDLEQKFGHGGAASHFQHFCPMAFGNTGGAWLQDSKETENPYFGAKMFRCGSVVETYTAHSGGDDS